MIKGLGDQENIIILNATELKNGIYGSKIFVEEFNTYPSGQLDKKINKDMEDITQLNSYRTLHPIIECTWKIHQDRLFSWP